MDDVVTRGNQVIETHETEGRRAYQAPSIKAMNETQVLEVFQMTAAKISAAGCWWTTCVPTA
jgi:hypothetical protein